MYLWYLGPAQYVSTVTRYYVVSICLICRVCCMAHLVFSAASLQTMYRPCTGKLTCPVELRHWVELHGCCYLPRKNARKDVDRVELNRCKKLCCTGALYITQSLDSIM